MEIDGHTIGDPKCHVCWNGRANPCECGGLVHNEFGDENYDGDYWLSYLCEKCGSTDGPFKG
jgi:hypothetical protein